MKLFGGALIWLGLGFLVHLIFVGTALDWNSAFTFFVVILWPAYLIYLFLWVVMWIAIVFGAMFLVWCAFCGITGRSIT